MNRPNYHQSTVTTEHMYWSAVISENRYHSKWPKV